MERRVRMGRTCLRGDGLGFRGVELVGVFFRRLKNVLREGREVSLSLLEA